MNCTMLLQFSIVKGNLSSIQEKHICSSVMNYGLCRAMDSRPLTSPTLQNNKSSAQWVSVWTSTRKISPQVSMNWQIISSKPNPNASFSSPTGPINLPKPTNAKNSSK